MDDATLIKSYMGAVDALTPNWQKEGLGFSCDCFLLQDYQKFPKAGGVYVFYCDCCDGPLYVGKTSNLRERFRTGHHVTAHLIPHKNVVIEFYYIEEKTVISHIERKWIMAGQPKYNREFYNG